jgi:hypothetical protein
MSTHYKSKSAATWLAIAGGTLGLHRFYLHGFGDKLGWLHPLPTALGIVGVVRIRTLGQDDTVAWLLVPLIGLMIAQAMLCAIVYGLTPDEKWDTRHNAGRPGPGTRWAPVLGAVLALMLGGAALTGAIAYGGQKFFEWQLQQQPKPAVDPSETPT